MIQARLVRYGSIDCYQVDGSDNPSILVILCHGYGASGRDLVGLVGEWHSILGDSFAKFRFLFPEAPQTLAELGMPDGHAWWPINMAQLLDHVEGNRFDELHDKEPPGIQAATEQLGHAIEQMIAGLDGAPTAIVLGGFSQGAMLTMNTSLRGNIDPPTLLFQFSGTTVCQNAWAENLGRLANTKVFQSHGQIDPILPHSSAETLRDLMTSGGVDVDFHSFYGEHTIDQGAVITTGKMLATL